LSGVYDLGYQRASWSISNLLGIGKWQHFGRLGISCGCQFTQFDVPKNSGGVVGMLIAMGILILGLGPPIVAWVNPTPLPDTTVRWMIVAPFTGSFITVLLLIAGIRLQRSFYPRFKLKVHPGVVLSGNSSRFVWMKVTNTSSHTLQRCQGQLQSIVPLSTSDHPKILPSLLNLPWSRGSLINPDNQREIDIGRRSSAYLDLAMMRGNDPNYLRIPRVPNLPNERPDYGEFVLPKGDYLISIKVKSLSAECESSCWVRVVFNGDFDVALSEMPAKAVKELSKIQQTSGFRQ
jgi:hypothetical protein